jgi:hypothetical protein
VQVGDCRRECMTIAKICETVLGEHDTDIAELLFHDTDLEEITNVLCNDLTPACVNPAPPFHGLRPDGEAWVQVDASQLKLNKVLAQMEGDGMSGEVGPFRCTSVMDALILCLFVCLACAALP